MSIAAEVRDALSVYGAEDATDSLDCRAAFADAIATAWYAADCPPYGSPAAADATRTAVRVFATWATEVTAT